MGEVELQSENNLLVIHATIYFYGDAANEFLSRQIAKNIADHWNEPRGKVVVKRDLYNVVFDMQGIYLPSVKPEAIYENTNPRNNYFRIEEYARENISFVDGLGSNTGYFKLENLLNNSTTA
ncbi:MAG: peptidase M10, partial [Ginsengibacter sp.]